MFLQNPLWNEVVYAKFNTTAKIAFLSDCSETFPNSTNNYLLCKTNSYLEATIYSYGCNHLFIYRIAEKLLEITCRRLIPFFLICCEFYSYNFTWPFTDRAKSKGEETMGTQQETFTAQKWSFLLRISSGIVIKSAYTKIHIYWRNP